MKFKITKYNKHGIAAIVTACGIHEPLMHLSYIKKVLAEEGVTTGVVIFDTFTIYGDTANRFIHGKLVDGEFQYDQWYSEVVPKNSDLRNTCDRILQDIVIPS